ncbi:GtrA family protein [Cyanobium sp. Morenito 9A2]|uniref:GtrA family protein n=1 Tax=Cyanobium sp. Morenito 9A2 TaxID=2823718 RepID=UPI0020CEE8D1|nr:GtrA family protein [Cyanobium sp. Morenito 9A2]MCP9848785.1 GtrA family protein [Cyanobium sp. Morenito 9A2]
MLNRSFTRYGLSGLAFTVIGPSLFWLMYPLGPFVALAIAQVMVHLCRYLVFRYLVFPIRNGFRVSPQRYVLSVLPLLAIDFLVVGILKGVLGRTGLTLVGGIVGFLVGFLWGRYVYSHGVLASTIAHE